MNSIPKKMELLDKNQDDESAIKSWISKLKINDNDIFVSKSPTKIKLIIPIDKYDNSKPIYLFTLNKRYSLDGDFSWNTAGLINHSCDNNCDYEGKGLKIWVTAIKDIKKR